MRVVLLAWALGRAARSPRYHPDSRLSPGARSGVRLGSDLGPRPPPASHHRGLSVGGCDEPTCLLRRRGAS